MLGCEAGSDLVLNIGKEECGVAEVDGDVERGWCADGRCHGVGDECLVLGRSRMGIHNELIARLLLMIVVHFLAPH